jgi:hypothetical protein
MGHMAYVTAGHALTGSRNTGFDPIRGDFWHQRKWSLRRCRCRELPFTSLVGGNNHHDRLGSKRV